MAVVRNLVVDWFRHRDGRRRLRKVVAELPPLQREAFQQVYVEGHWAAETHEITKTNSDRNLTFSCFLRALRDAQRTVSEKRPSRLLTELGPSPRKWEQVTGPADTGHDLSPTQHARVGHFLRGRDEAAAVQVDGRWGSVRPGADPLPHIWEE